MDQLEKYIRQNRHRLDRELPPENVKRNLFNEEPKSKWLRRFQLAAAVALIGVSVLGILYIQSHQNGKNNMAQLPAEIEEAEVYYASLISLKSSEIKEIAKEFPEVSADFNAELDTLDNLYGQLRMDFRKNSQEGLVADEMIRNLQLRVEVLNKQLDLLNQLKNYKNENDK